MAEEESFLGLLLELVETHTREPFLSLLFPFLRALSRQGFPAMGVTSRCDDSRETPDSRAA